MYDPLAPRPGEKFFWDTDYAQVHALRNAGQLDKAEHLLMKAIPVPAVLDELRKVAYGLSECGQKAWAYGIIHKPFTKQQILDEAHRLLEG